MLAKIILTGLLAGGAARVSAQVITEPARALAARDSLLQTAAATRLELAEQTTLVLKIRRKTRRHIARGYSITPQGMDPHTGERKRGVVWEHRIIYRRNGRIQEKYTAYLLDRPILEERWLNGSVLWLRMGRPQDLRMTKFAQDQPAYNGTYIRGGYVSWQGRKYRLPQGLEAR
ncbi:hypothetical protein [Hymenobacter rubripertinctus]|uniref:Uncharacterized protein n=1 Tax=Hymenobacter rubripertinctus TaxID=2029981 RepID=A0A418QS71_9BACT|nr:hypothetical protein [Hymenobacter rubripertinctus]RIY07952.1 hypothetical protein D0T11_15390 [Hymenobacter rubripertinctus]